MIETETFLAALSAGSDLLGLAVSAELLELPETIASQTVAVDASTDGETAVDELLACAKVGRWCVVNLVDGSLPPALYNQLRNLAATGHLQINRGDSVEDFTWPKDTRLIVTATPEAYEKISIPTFSNLFGPVLR